MTPLYIERHRMRYTVAQIVDAVRQGTIVTADEVIADEKGISAYTVRNVVENLRMPPLVLHRQVVGKAMKYTILVGAPLVLALVVEARRIKDGISTLNAGLFWSYTVDIDFLDGDMEKAKEDAERIRKARW